MKRSDVFEPREPPPHGWTRLKARLEERQRARWPWVLAAGVVVILVAVLGRAPVREVDTMTAQLAMAKLAGSTADSEPVMAMRTERVAVMRVATQNPQVVMYRVAMLSKEDAAPTE